MQIGETFSLSEFIKLNEADITQFFLQHHFSCIRNPDIERFLHHNAVRFEQARVARTYLILNDNSDILAYFTLSFKSIEVKTTTKSTLKRLTGGLTNDNQINAFLLGQIGKNSQIKNNPLHLSDILSAVFSQIEIAQRIIGGRVLILECENNMKLIQLYEQNGFKLIDTVEDKHQLKTLFIIPKFSEQAD